MSIANAQNVAGVYSALRDDIIHETRNVPDFQNAVRLTRLVDPVLDSSARGARVGVRVRVSDWPKQSSIEQTHAERTPFAHQESEHRPPLLYLTVSRRVAYAS